MLQSKKLSKRTPTLLVAASLAVIGTTVVLYRGSGYEASNELAATHEACSTSGWDLKIKTTDTRRAGTNSGLDMCIPAMHRCVHLNTVDCNDFKRGAEDKFAVFDNSEGQWGGDLPASGGIEQVLLCNPSDDAWMGRAMVIDGVDVDATKVVLSTDLRDRVGKFRKKKGAEGECVVYDLDTSDGEYVQSSVQKRAPPFPTKDARCAEAGFDKVYVQTKDAKNAGTTDDLVFCTDKGMKCGKLSLGDGCDEYKKDASYGLDIAMEVLREPELQGGIWLCISGDDQFYGRLAKVGVEPPPTQSEVTQYIYTADDDKDWHKLSRDDDDKKAEGSCIHYDYNAVAGVYTFAPREYYNASYPYDLV